MSITTINLNGNTVSVVALPSSPGLRSVEFDINETVAVSKSIFTGQTQLQRWPGADWLSGTATLPPLTQAQADTWIAALMQCQGGANAFMLGDPMKATPRGNPQGTPAVDSSHGMPAGTSVLYTSGWQASKTGLLLPGDYIQINGVRLHRVLDQVNSNADGKASISIFPSLRETPSGSIVTLNPKGIVPAGNESDQVERRLHAPF